MRLWHNLNHMTIPQLVLVCACVVVIVTAAVVFIQEVRRRL